MLSIGCEWIGTVKNLSSHLKSECLFKECDFNFDVSNFCNAKFSKNDVCKHNSESIISHVNLMKDVIISLYNDVKQLKNENSKLKDETSDLKLKYNTLLSYVILK